jgi:hypothetical protein
VPRRQPGFARGFEEWDKNHTRARRFSELARTPGAQQMRAKFRANFGNRKQ